MSPPALSVSFLSYFSFSSPSLLLHLLSSHSYFHNLVLAFVAYHLLAIEDTHVLLHIATSLLLVIATTYSLHRLLDFFILPLSRHPFKRTQEAAQDAQDAQEVSRTYGTAQEAIRTRMAAQEVTRAAQKPRANYTRAVALIGTLVCASILRAQVSPGFSALALAMVCFACVILVYIETVPFAVTSIILLTAWWIVCYVSYFTPFKPPYPSPSPPLLTPPLPFPLLSQT